MKKLVVPALVALLSSVILHKIYNSKNFSKSESGKQREMVTLEKKNTLGFRDVVTYNSIKHLQKRAFEISGKLPKTEPIYLVLDTPGGSIAAGQELINSLNSLPQEVKTLTNFSASMGYIIVQSLGERLVLPTGTLMMHRAYVGMEGQVPGEFNSRSRYWLKRIENLETDVATRMNLSLEKYQKLVKDEFWVDGHDAVSNKAADKVTLASCSMDLLGTYVQKLDTFFGTVYITWSECPLITTPLEVDLADLDRFSGFNGNQSVENAKKVLLSVLFDKKAIVSNPKILENYLTVVK